MKRKLFLALFVLVMSIGLMACKAEQTVETVQVSSEVEEEEQTVDESSENDSKSDSEWVMPEVERVEETVKESEITWYMDEEGVKNEEIGVVVKKDNSIFEELKFYWGVGVHLLKETGGSVSSLHYFECFYYDGEFTNYVSENGMQMDTVNGVEYAYKYNESWRWTDIAIGGDGIVVNFHIDPEEERNEFLSNFDFIKPCDEFEMDCLAYFTREGFYSPAIGISMSCEGTEHMMDYYFLECANKGGDAGVAHITISDESIDSFIRMRYMTETDTAQTAIDKFAERYLDTDYASAFETTAIDGIVETNLGNNAYIGRGVSGASEERNDKEWWFFCSDDTTWSIDCNFEKEDGMGYEHFLSVLEPLQ